MNPWLADADVTLYHGDVLAVLRDLPAESVDCCVTSPPYWGLRDYGTGAWEGGDEACDHVELDADAIARSTVTSTLGAASGGNDMSDEGRERSVARQKLVQFRKVCGKCGARRIDQQLGLEPTPEQYVERMVEVFREVRRVLAEHGTVWLNLGDSYAGSNASQGGDGSAASYQDGRAHVAGAMARQAQRTAQTTPMKIGAGLKQKDLCGIPWRVAFALQADGWYLRSDIIWAKPNPMPESVTDRPTKAHEYVFLLSKQPRYFFDTEAVREAHKEPWRSTGRVENRGKKDVEAGVNNGFGLAGDTPRLYNPAGRNIRSVWPIATQPYPDAHFATFPEELARRCIAAGCPEQVCRVCGKARERIVERESYITRPTTGRPTQKQKVNPDTSMGLGRVGGHVAVDTTTLGFTDCGHSDYRPGIVLDMFGGSGTTALVARKLGRHAVLIELSEDYCALAAKRLSQQSLFA